ncbi:MAG: 16S rRNA (cytosine(1402)-N(4))-methyltransferase RsmH [Clostridia bacterium]|nr:16S rRNA (cytosine(1402)-N(4))-methyltransferase RsmH [Clostridia bacterium]
MEFNHKTVLLSETLEYLSIDPDGVYVDGTAGGGGLSIEIAKRLSPKGKLVCIDQDPDAVSVCKERLKRFGNVEFIQDNFANISSVVHSLGIESVSGVALDIGVSSYQLDEASRGFSYSKEAKLDMRMSKSGISAYDVVNSFDVGEIKNIISKYGEERFAGRIAQSIVDFRAKKPIETTTCLSDIVVNAIPCGARRTGGHPAKRTFQAIRIFVNDELENLAQGLKSAFDLLSSGGRLAVITFHSLEDRIVKNQMKDWTKGCICPPDFPVCVCWHRPKAKLVCRKAVTPTKKELEDNMRSRSAKLRVAEKL